MRVSWLARQHATERTLMPVARHDARPVNPKTGEPLLPRDQPGYYPGFSTLSQKEFWDQATRNLVLARVEANSYWVPSSLNSMFNCMHESLRPLKPHSAMWFFNCGDASVFVISYFAYGPGVGMNVFEKMDMNFALAPSAALLIFCAARYRSSVSWLLNTSRRDSARRRKLLDLSHPPRCAAGGRLGDRIGDARRRLSIVSG